MDKVSQIQNQIILSFKTKNFERLGVLKVLLSKIKNKQIELKGQHKDFKDEDFSSLVLTEIKQRQESVVAFREGGREELAQKEEKELDILKEFAPKLLSFEEVVSVVEKAVNDFEGNSTPNLGQVMGQVMPLLKGKAEGELVNKAVCKVLNL